MSQREERGSLEYASPEWAPLGYCTVGHSNVRLVSWQLAEGEHRIACPACMFAERDDAMQGRAAAIEELRSSTDANLHNMAELSKGLSDCETNRNELYDDNVRIRAERDEAQQRAEILAGTLTTLSNRSPLLEEEPPAAPVPVTERVLLRTWREDANGDPMEPGVTRHPNGTKAKRVTRYRVRRASGGDGVSDKTKARADHNETQRDERRNWSTTPESVTCKTCRRMVEKQRAETGKVVR